MGPTVIGVDPHKRSHTAVVLDEHEEIEAQLRLAADRRQLERLLGWADSLSDGLETVRDCQLSAGRTGGTSVVKHT
jgi:hypothetical protein